MKIFTHAVVQTEDENGTSKTALLDMETVSLLTQPKVKQLVSHGPNEIPKELLPILSWDLAGMKAAIVKAEKQGILDENSSMEEIEAYLEQYQKENNIDLGLPKLSDQRKHGDDQE